MLNFYKSYATYTALKLQNFQSDLLLCLQYHLQVSFRSHRELFTVTQLRYFPHSDASVAVDVNACKHDLCEASTNLMSPPHHQVGENSDPQDGANKRHGKIPPGRLENTKDNQ